MIPTRNFKRFFHKTLRQPAYALRVLKKRVQAYGYYAFRGGESCFPESLTLFLTHRCNLRCKMCGQWGEGGVTRTMDARYVRGELTINELLSAIDGLAAFKPNITLFGGEPLLYSGCLRAIRHIKGKGMHCLMITNGSLLEEFTEEIVDSGLDELNVSIDGNSRLHDRIRGMPRLFDKIMGGLKNIQLIKARRHKKKPLVNLQCTITRFNYRHLEELPEVAGQAKADSLTFHNLIFVNKEIVDRQKEFDELLGCSSDNWKGFLSEPGIEPELLHAKIKEILSGKYRFSVDFFPSLSYPSLRQYYRNAAYLPAEYPGRCRSPWMAAYILPDGEVRPCLNIDYSFGNVRKEKISSIWNNGRAKRFRKILKTNRIFPVCVRCTELYRY